MNIFFIASIYGKKKYQANYEKLVKLVKDSGHKFTYEHVMTNDHRSMTEHDEKADLKFHRDLINNIKRTDAVFAELSYTSTSAGYLVALAASIGKPVVIFYSGSEEPHLFKMLELTNDKLIIVRYKGVDDLNREVPLMIDFISEVQDTRFNFFVSPIISNYLDFISREKRVPRSVYLRKLIEQDMEADSEFQNAIV